MELTILDADLRAVSHLDTFDSLIWTERYYEAGDFEIYTSYKPNLLTQLTVDRYLYLRGSEGIMIIEEIEITTDVEEGDHCTITGRSLESILTRRILLQDISHEGSVQDLIATLLNDNIISPQDEARKIDNFIFEESTDPSLTEIETTISLSAGEEIYTLISELCQIYDIGFKLVLTDDYKFKFSLYKGVDRSYTQLQTPYVIFSPNYDNLFNSRYFESVKNMKNIVIADGVGSIGSVDISGLQRREVFMSSSGSEDEQITEAGKLLKDNPYEKYVEGEVYVDKYDGQFFMGDIVQLENEYGMQSRSRMTELIRSQSASETGLYPKFTLMEDE